LQWYSSVDSPHVEGMWTCNLNNGKSKWPSPMEHGKA
jgi:hypothetical protein